MRNRHVKFRQKCYFGENKFQPNSRSFRRKPAVSINIAMGIFGWGKKPRVVKWGILGCGNIASKFAQGLATLPDAQLWAAGSRSLEKSMTFIQTHGAAHAYGSYEELLANEEVEIVYVATPHNFHYEQVKQCFDAGKHVLCEKPLTINAVQAEELIAIAAEKGLFFMEAMWTRFLPATARVRKWLAKGKIGEVRMFTANFGFHSEWEPESRKFNPDLAGGALLDIGIYPIAYAYMIFGEEPVSVSSTAHIGKTSVDNQSAYLFGYENGAFAHLYASYEAESTKDAVIMGTKGQIRLPLFWKADLAQLTLNGGKTKTYKSRYESTGLQFQAKEAMDCIRKEKTQSDLMPLSETLRILRMMDRLRADWNLSYPGEESNVAENDPPQVEIDQ